MRVFIYEHNEELLNTLSERCGLSPTKYLNTLLESKELSCHTNKAEVNNNDQHKGNVRGRVRLT